MLAYGCHLFSPPAPLPPCLLPHFSFICMLFLLFHTSLLNCHVLSLCAQTLRPALNLQLMVGISTFLFMWLILTCILSLQHAYFHCCTLLCQAAQPGNVSCVSDVSHLLIVLTCLFRPQSSCHSGYILFDFFMNCGTYFLYITYCHCIDPGIALTVSHSLSWYCTCEMVAPTNQLQCFPEGATEE